MNSEVDLLILSFARVQWRKVAMITSQVLLEFRRRGIDADEYAVAGRIRHWSRMGDWRHKVTC
jgi:hypothetical protein